MNVHPFAKVKRQAFSSSKKIYRKSTEGVDKREPSYTVGGDVNWYSRCGNTVWRFFKKLKIELPYDPVIPFLDIHLDKNLKRYMHPNVQRNTIYHSQDLKTT